MHQQFDLVSISAFIDQSPSFSLAGAETDPEHVIKICRIRTPDAALLHAGFPDGRAFHMAELLLLSKSVKAVALLDDRYVLVRAEMACELQYCCYLTRESSPQQIYSEISKILVSRSRPSDAPVRIKFPRIAHSELAANDRFGILGLSAREREIMTYIAAGKTVQQTAHATGIAHSTVENHKSRIMKKLGIHRTADLARTALCVGHIEFDAADFGNAQRRSSTAPPRPHMVLGRLPLGQSRECDVPP
jgi:DNA-binding NarL/FixJ family response regulator